MSVTSYAARPKGLGAFATWGVFWLAVALLGALAFFWEGIQELLVNWQTPEYSHGPLIPVLSGLLFLRQLKEEPIHLGPVDRRPGLAVVALALLMGALGTFAQVPDIVAYGLIVWTFGILLVSFGWNQGKHFWPPVVHLVYMLPLPALVYYKTSTWLQLISSELGVFFLHLLNVPVYLDGNIIDLGVYKLLVAEACSGLRYLFPIMSFSYVFAVLYRGPMWHKAVLLISAAPITVVMNSVRIAIAGTIVNTYGVEWVEGFTHFFEGWVIFISCVVILFGLAKLMLMLRPEKLGLAEALDLDMSGLVPQAMRIRLVEASGALIATALLMVGAAALLEMKPDREGLAVSREPFALFPRTLGEWEVVGAPQRLEPGIERVLAADDYVSLDLLNPDAAAPVGLFMAWYDDQIDDGVHSPEVCLPGSGWEIAWLERTDISDRLGTPESFHVNRAIIQRGESRMMVFYWFEQKGRHLAWDFTAKFYLLWDGMTSGRTDGALVRLTTPIEPDESDEAAEARLMGVMENVLEPLPRFVPGA